MKLDVRTKMVQLWTEKACFPSEPVFVPQPSADHEDDGKYIHGVIPD